MRKLDSRTRVRRSGSAPLAPALLTALWLGWVPGCAGPSGEPAGKTARPAAAIALPDRARVQFEAGQAALRAGDKERALAEFTKALEVNPNFVPAHMGVGDIYRMDRNWAMAQPSFARAAQLEPSNFDAQYFNGLMLQLLNRVTEAIAAYGRALRLRPDDFNSTLNLSAAYYSLDENAQALAYGREAVRLRPDNGPARLNLGAIYAAMDRHREAVKEFQQAAELMDLSPVLLMNMAESLGRLQRYEEMRNTLEQLLRMESTAAAHERMGFALFGLRRYDEALASFERALAIDPNYTAALNGQGVILMNRWLLSNQSDHSARERAIAAWRRSLQLDRSQPKIVELLTRYGG